jgi:hypothetical protein
LKNSGVGHEVVEYREITCCVFGKISLGFTLGHLSLHLLGQYQLSEEQTATILRRNQPVEKDAIWKDVRKKGGVKEEQSIVEFALKGQ